MRRPPVRRNRTDQPNEKKGRDRRQVPNPARRLLHILASKGGTSKLGATRAPRRITTHGGSQGELSAGIGLGGEREKEKGREGSIGPPLDD